MAEVKGSSMSLSGPVVTTITEQRTSFVRNSAFDAKNFFDPASKPIPPFRLNQFGANIGGPVVIPHVFNGRDKLFFFADYEGKRVSQAQTFTSTVPTAAFKRGDFSALLPATQIFAPRTPPRTPFPRNQVPITAWDPTSIRLLQLFPDQNLTGITANYLYNPPQITTAHQGDIRVDYRTEKSSLFGRMSKENPDTITPGF